MDIDTSAVMRSFDASPATDAVKVSEEVIAPRGVVGLAAREREKKVWCETD